MILTFTLSVLCLVLDVEGGWGSQRNIIHPPQRNDCARKCVYGQPRTCYYYFHIEQYSTMGWSCNNCTVPSDCQCILADGVERSVYTANRMIPGPKIEVCEGDKVVVDVENTIDGSEVTIHWHGIWQRDTQYYDGVPFVTQCPILSGNTFRYTWFAKNAGTHFWHAHTGMQKLDGLSGPVIIRQSASRDYHGSSYGNDLSEHVIIINDWFPYFATETLPGALRRTNLLGQLPHSLLINGKGQTIHPDTSVMTQTPLQEFNVTSGQTYRFRLINAMATICPVILTIDQHTLTAIASDGEPFERIVVNGIQSYSGKLLFFFFGNGELMTHRVDSIEYTSPPSPLISQIKDISPSQLCNKNKKPKNCGEICSCTHVIELPLNAVVELILIDDSSPVGSPHTIHLHGYAFNVMGMGIVPNGTGSSVAKLTNLDRRDMLERRFYQPAFKDTLTVPSNGYAVVRFRANNPGFWFFHCHFMYHMAIGMEMVLQVGNFSHIPPIPKGFPKCGSYIPNHW
ncbi:hypothetical protein RI129_005608 [Pyrocoelia pectoralis]|uniref:Laccase n=1 Tax=Pyrocoelia pectoralis TaxID=417401 RepID=A0AAN7VCI8_9COLE